MPQIQLLDGKIDFNKSINGFDLTKNQQVARTGCFNNGS